MHIVSLGEILWDVIGEAEYLGGAPLNFSAASVKLENSVELLSAVGDDQRGSRALRGMEELGLSTVFVQRIKDRPTGAAVVSSDVDGNIAFMIERPAAFNCVVVDRLMLDELTRHEPDWIYFGTLAHTNAQSEESLLRILNHMPGARRFYDVNLRSGHWNLDLVKRLSSTADVMKLNQSEAELLHSLSLQAGSFNLEKFCRNWSSIHQIATLCVTLGSAGCAIYSDGELQTYNGFNIQTVDTVGAGDAFAAALLHGLHQNWPMRRTASLANALGAIVASRHGATPEWSMDECVNLIVTQTHESVPST